MLGALVRLPTVAVGAIGVGIIVLHNLLDGIKATSWNGPPDPPPTLAQGLWQFFHQPGLIAPFGFPGPVAYVMYPVLAWVGVIAASPIDWRDPGPRGFSLWVVYAVWIGGVVLLYPLCKWFAGVKARRKKWWLSYL